MVPIPHPYTGLTLRKGNREVNVHSVDKGEVYYGLYDFIREDRAYYCIGLYRKPVEEFMDQVGGHIARGDAEVFSLIDDREPLELRG